MNKILIIIILLSINIRWLISRLPYSGYGKPPLYGDYEAQRHWMEITINLEPKLWYKNSTHNDLQYWGLDYPPLTAYHSYINGLISQLFNPKWVELFKSRGFESYHHKIFMRSTVLISDIIFFYSGIIYFWINCYKSSLSSQNKLNNILLSLLYPGIILIDHGHFQYNCISLGLTIWAVCFLKKSHLIFSAIFFCLALNYKQMCLYYSFPFFFYLLGLIINKPTLIKKILTFISLSLTVFATFFILWLPFLDDYGKSVLIRIFPIERGLFEDKVANLWCILDVFFKIKQNFDKENLALFIIILNFFLLLPSSINLLLNPSFARFKYSLVNSSLIFYLLSYHVHEKQILLPSIAVFLLLDCEFYAGFLFSIISIFSLFPLLIKDQIYLQYFTLTAIYILFFYILNKNKKNWIQNLVFIGVILGCLILSLVQVIFKPPAKYPDIFTLANATFSCVWFLIFTIYFHFKQFILKEDSSKACSHQKTL